MKKSLKRAAVLAAAGIAGIQFVPVDRTNPPGRSEIAAPDDVLSLLRRSCFDCHSHETRWPWYSKVAPVSWLVAHDVHEARGRLNFSVWDGLSPGKRNHDLEEIWTEVSEGGMPLGKYLRLHPDARLSPGDLSLLREWTKGGEGGGTGEDREGD
ncbi:MAG: heme-binding domain-containing protein [Candidatus Eisenbacteria bacterium]